MVLSSWRGHCESSPGSFNECSLSARWLPTLKPSQLTWPVSPQIACYRPHSSSALIIVIQPESWYSFHHPMEGRRLSRPRYNSKGVQCVPKAVYHAVRFEPGSSHTAVMHATTTPLWPVLPCHFFVEFCAVLNCCDTNFVYWDLNWSYEKMWCLKCKCWCKCFNIVMM